MHYFVKQYFLSGEVSLMWEYLVKKIRNPKITIRHDKPSHVPKVFEDAPVKALQGSAPKEDEYRYSVKMQNTRRVLLCPVCHNEMDRLHIRSIEIDECPVCKGVFLDSGELQKVIGDNPVTWQQTDDQPEEPELTLYSPEGLK
jgi:Zn-finger nucleic acid-binding protein